MATVNFTTSEAEAVIIALKQAKRKLELQLANVEETTQGSTPQERTWKRALNLRLAETKSALERIDRLG